MKVYKYSMELAQSFQHASECICLSGFIFTNVTSYINMYWSLQRCVMVSKLVCLDQLQRGGKFDSHWALPTFGIVSHVSYT